ncbi:MAG: hypothetical protein GYB64_19655 [Chloroflexi bacterium]|nr:hypothetical protein [Chloroflexota bacterium]
MPNKPIVVLGTYAFAEEVVDLVADIGDLDVAAFAENRDKSRCDRPLLGRPVIWVDDLARYKDEYLAFCAIGTTHRKAYIQQVAAMGFEFATLIHPAATVLSTARVGAGSLVGPGTVIASHTQVDHHVIINRGCLVGHHTRIGAYSTISPGANIAGRVTIGERAYIAMGAVIVNDIQIGPSSMVGAGALVTRDVPERVQVLGVPAMIAREDFDGY